MNLPWFFCQLSYTLWTLENGVEYFYSPSHCNTVLFRWYVSEPDLVYRSRNKSLSSGLNAEFQLPVMNVEPL